MLKIYINIADWCISGTELILDWKTNLVSDKINKNLRNKTAG